MNNPALSLIHHATFIIKNYLRACEALYLRASKALYQNKPNLKTAIIAISDYSKTVYCLLLTGHCSKTKPIEPNFNIGCSSLNLHQRSAYGDFTPRACEAPQSQIHLPFTRDAHRVSKQKSRIVPKGLPKIPHIDTLIPKPNLPRLFRVPRNAFTISYPRFSKNTIEKSPRMHVEIPNPKDPMFYTAHDPCF